MHIPFFDQWFVIAIIGLLLFGKRLPEVGRSLGKGIVEFKKGIRGIEDDIDVSSTSQQPRYPQQPPQPYQQLPPQQMQPPQPYRFDPYSGKPLGNENNSAGQQAQQQQPPASSSQ